MRNRSRAQLGAAALALVALLAYATLRALQTDPFEESTPQLGVEAPLAQHEPVCQQAAPPPNLASWQVSRIVTRMAQDPPPPDAEDVVALNGRGYNYSVRRLPSDPALIRAEALRSR
jgi:hypothetical protein